MKQIDRQTWESLLKQTHLKQRFIKSLRFVPEEVAWEDHDFAAITDRNGSKGILLIEHGSYYLIPFELKKGIVDRQTGRSHPITCDFCCTWQQGTRAASITFIRLTDNHTFTYLCCADLRCSLHVRDKTPEALLSRAQLREDLSPKQRIERLKKNIERIIIPLAGSPVSL